MKRFKKGEIVTCVRNSDCSDMFPTGFNTTVVEDSKYAFGYEYVDVKDVNGKVVGLNAHRFARVGGQGVMNFLNLSDGE